MASPHGHTAATAAAGPGITIALPGVVKKKIELEYEHEKTATEVLILRRNRAQNGEFP